MGTSRILTLDSLLVQASPRNSSKMIPLTNLPQFLIAQMIVQTLWIYFREETLKPPLAFRQVMLFPKKKFIQSCRDQKISNANGSVVTVSKALKRKWWKIWTICLDHFSMILTGWIWKSSNTKTWVKTRNAHNFKMLVFLTNKSTKVDEEITLITPLYYFIYFLLRSLFFK